MCTVPVFTMNCNAKGWVRQTITLWEARSPDSSLTPHKNHLHVDHRPKTLKLPEGNRESLHDFGVDKIP